MTFTQKLFLHFFRTRLNLLALLSPKRSAKLAFKLFCTPFRKPKKQIPPIFQQAEQLSFELEGHTIRGYRWNHPKEQKVLIIHGFESTARNFDRYVTPLLNKGYEVLAFDAPAHGFSGGQQITLPLYVQTLQQVHQLYGPINSFLAHSFGGLALVHFLESIPHSPATKAVLIAPATETTSAIDAFFTVLRVNPIVRPQFDQLIYDISGLRPVHFSIRRAMQHIQAQVLWFHDEQDDLTPLADALKVRDDGHPLLHFTITHGLGHRAIYRDNKVIQQVIEFL
jgi:pimeloyl-ACP methyl ester carboxylesterase